MKSLFIFSILVFASMSQASFTCNYSPYDKDEDTTNFPTYVIDLKSDSEMTIEDISSQDTFQLARAWNYQPTKANKGFIKFLPPNTQEFRNRHENAFHYLIVSPNIQKNKRTGNIKLAFEVGGGHGLYYDLYTCTRD